MLKKNIRNVFMLGICTSMLIGTVAGATIANPNFNSSSDTSTYSEVNFGYYPQSEITGTALTSNITGATYNTSGDAIVDGTKYRKVSTYYSETGTVKQYSQTHYYRYDPITWNVLSTANNQIKLQATKRLDYQIYSISDTKSYSSSNIRTYLNGEFYNTAFSDSEKSDIITVSNNKVTLPSMADLISTSYGFNASLGASTTRKIEQTAYCSGKDGSTSNNWYAQDYLVGEDGSLSTLTDNGGLCNKYRSYIPQIVISSTSSNLADLQTSASTSSLAATKKLTVSIVNTKSHKLTWKTVSGAASYGIYRSTSKNGTYKKIATTKKLTYTVKKLTLGKTYYYKVAGIDASSQIGAYSAIKSKKAGTPAKPTLTAKKSTYQGKKVVVLRWKKVSDATGIEVYKQSGKTWSKLYSGNLSSNNSLKKGCRIAYTYTSGTFNFKIRTYKKVKGKKIYSSYSSKHKVTI